MQIYAFSFIFTDFLRSACLIYGKTFLFLNGEQSPVAYLFTNIYIYTYICIVDAETIELTARSQSLRQHKQNMCKILCHYKGKKVGYIRDRDDRHRCDVGMTWHMVSFQKKVNFM